MVFEGLEAAKLLENVVSGAFSTFWKKLKKWYRKGSQNHWKVVQNRPWRRPMAIDRLILGILKRSKKSWNFDVVLNGQKIGKLAPKRPKGAKIHHAGGPSIGFPRIMAPGRPRARPVKWPLDWKMANGQKEMENGKWEMANDKNQVARKREMASEMI